MAGVGHGDQTTAQLSWNILGECASHAIREAIARFIVSFREVPGTADWLRSMGLEAGRAQTRALRDEEIRRRLRLEIENARRKAADLGKEIEIRVGE